MGAWTGQTFAGIVKSLVKSAELIIRGNSSIIGDNTGDQIDKTLPFSDNTVSNASKEKHGYLPKLPDSLAVYLNGKGLWAVPSGTGVSTVTATLPLISSGGLTPDISTVMNTGKIIGRGSGGSGVMEEITLGTNLVLVGNTLNATTIGTPPGGETLTAVAGGQAAATQSAKQNVLVDTVAVAGNGVKTVDATVDASQIFRNRGALSMNVYPKTGEEIYKGLVSLGVNMPYPVASRNNLSLFCFAIGKWRD